VELYTKCWNEDPDERPTIEFILTTLDTISWKTKSTSTPDISEMPTDDHVENSALFSLPINISNNTEELDEKLEFLEQIHTEIKRIFLLGPDTADTIRQIMEKTNNQGESVFLLLQQHNYTSKFPFLMGICYYFGIGNTKM